MTTSNDTDAEMQRMLNAMNFFRPTEDMTFEKHFEAVELSSAFTRYYEALENAKKAKADFERHLAALRLLEAKGKSNQ